ncbi:YhcN/YlaJ family sporulation lipoprotein [Effusibacillus lacus]|uniref:Sporulation protein n=1 Tax=Effusibacillus lacus TaxID=1348429 RepID=A0A292YPR4_9BACL|nr:YhcN/YlaJ family sporulation lipoprotein [Effusibacillus lacus]TCS73568.1 hypothetical protein EDD64_11875 [Effusibacillus lacus]GAX91938.1 hypothetical protein EFBL_3629 [Effusibacillus lacus]
MRPRTYLLTMVLALTLSATLAACKMQGYQNRHSGDLKEADPPEMISEGIKADYRIAEELNKIPGVQGAAVLIHNGEAYVGAYIIGDEKNPDAYMKKPFGSYYGNQNPWASGNPQNGTTRSPFSGKGIPPSNSQGAAPSGPQGPNPANPQGVPQTNAQGAPQTDFNGVDQFGQNTNNDPENRQGDQGTASDPDRAGTATGNIDGNLLKKIQDKVKSMAPDVKTVHFTNRVDQVGQLQGYARYIQDGGSMDRFAQDFDQTMKRIWPDAKP